MKKPQDEQQLWAVCYAVAASLLTLGRSANSARNDGDEGFAEVVDKRAAAIADKAVKRLKGKLP